MIKIAVCDDDREFATKFIKIIKKGYVELSDDKDIECIYCSSRSEIVKAYLNYDIAAVFMDIRIGSINGFDVARELNKIDDNLGIIYITGYDYYITEAFVCRPLGFIRKGMLEADCKRAFISLNEYISKRKRTIFFNDGIRKIRLKVDEIMVVEVYDHNLVIVGLHRDKTVRDKLIRVEPVLANFGFVRISRNRMVNLSYVDCILKGDCIMVNGDSYKISGSRVKYVRDEVMSFKLRC